MIEVKCIHFDLDSVLYVYTDFIERAIRECTSEMIARGLNAGHDDAIAKLRQIRAKDPNSHQHFDELCYHFNKSYDKIIIASAIERYWEIKNTVIKPVFGAKTVLKTLRDAGYVLTIVTNGIPIKQAGKVVKLGLDKYFYNPENGKFNFFAGLENGKPKAHLWNEAKKRTGIEHKDSVMVGDRLYSDIYGANRLKMKTILVRQGPHASETPEEVYRKKGLKNRDFFRLCRPDAEVDDIREIPKIITQFNKS